ncbi:hypothetical protein BDZ45DRAFT_742407 [Acephala macrosclerotiorum]|nr:hypothetical protein BDZ45DRAFT_742407 [Acephala macrosclerotiorum]
MYMREDFIHHERSRAIDLSAILLAFGSTIVFSVDEAHVPRLVQILRPPNTESQRSVPFGTSPETIQGRIQYFQASAEHLGYRSDLVATRTSGC